MTSRYIKVYHFKDYVQVVRDSDGNIEYNVSPTHKEDYNKRLYGIAFANGKWYFAAIINHNDPKKRHNIATAKKTVTAKLHSLINDDSTPFPNGTTWVPEDYLEYIQEDPYCYSALYGPILNAIDFRDNLKAKQMTKMHEKRRSQRRVQV